jgi:hypothetical protein
MVRRRRLLGELHPQPRDFRRHPLILDGLSTFALRADARLDSGGQVLARSIQFSKNPNSRLRCFVGGRPDFAPQAAFGCSTERSPSAFSSSGEPYDPTNWPPLCQPLFRPGAMSGAPADAISFPMSASADSVGVASSRRLRQLPLSAGHARFSKYRGPRPGCQPQQSKLSRLVRNVPVLNSLEMSP